ncbi:MAG: SGNH/GDSL hydrolase family protein [Pseudomonadales bacterium]|nr:SGNH/GDSL hydrolase family protein [Pseudomonadales bacterium]
MPSFSIKDLVNDADDNRIAFRGALDFDIRENGISPRRLPSWTRHQVPQMMDVMARMPSGVRLLLETDATEITVSGLATNMVTPPASKKDVVMNLEVDRQLLISRTNQGNTIELNRADPDAFKLIRGAAGRWTFMDLPAGNKRCEIWLPHNAFIELHELSINEGATLNTPSVSDKPKWIHYGSSISHCMEADQPALVWPAVAARIADVDLQNLGFGGQCQLDQFVARTIRDSDADLISLKVGINIINIDSMRERIFQPALHGFLDTIREGKPDTPITLISPIYCPSAETSPGPTIADANGKFITLSGHEEIRAGCMTLNRVRTLMTQVVKTRDDANLSYVNGLDLFGHKDAINLPDDLHPNPDGYVTMGERFATMHLAQQSKAISL